MTSPSPISTIVRQPSHGRIRRAPRHSAYSFLDGASQPEELAARAAELGYEALALTDHDGVYGSLEFAHAAKAFGVRPITGAEVTLDGGAHVTLLVETRAGLREPLPAAHRRRMRARAGPDARIASRCRRRVAARDSSRSSNEGLVCLSGCARRRARPCATRTPRRALAGAFGRERFFVELQRPYERGDARRQRRSCATSPSTSASRRSRPATSTRTTRGARCSRTCSSRSAAAPRSTAASRSGAATARAVLRSPEEMLERFPRRPRRRRSAPASSPSGSSSTSPRSSATATPTSPTATSRRSASSRAICDARLRRALPRERHGVASAGARAARRGARADRRARARRLLPPPLRGARAGARVRAARCAGAARRGTSCRPGRGRGSSVGSIVCYLTGLSHVDPVATSLSLGRFLNRELASVPDIDLDFPRDIREKLIVARHRALRARARRARRELLDLPLARRDPRRRQGARPAVRRARAARAAHRRLEREARRRGARAAPGRASASSSRSAGARSPSSDRRDRRPAAPRLAAPGRDGRSRRGRSSSSSPCSRRRWPAASSASGTRTPAPTPASSRSTCSGSGCSRRSRTASSRSRALHGEPIDLSRIPLDDPAVYDEIQRADTVGDFQIESRAQMQSLLRTRPGEPRRPDRPGRARAAGADPGQGRAPVHRARGSGCARTRPSSPRSTTSSLREPLRDDARRRRLPGPGARGRDRARRLHASGRRRGCAAR